jgi:uncharacterized membrane protein
LRRLLLLLMGAVILAIVKAVLMALAIALLLALVYAFVSRPAETLLFLAVLAFLSLAIVRPMACIVTLGIVSVVAVVADARPKSRRQLRLDDSCKPRSR